MHATPTDWQGAGAFYDHRGYSIFYRDSGASEKPVLLLIHGFPTASWDWYAVWDALAEKFRVIAPDMIGFGHSAKPEHYHYAIRDQADLHCKLCRHLGVKAAHLLAHDYGVSVAQELLARDGEWMEALQVQSIVFLNGGLFAESHRPRLVQKLLHSPIGPLVGRLNNERSFAKSFAALFGPNTKPSAEEMRQFWLLASQNGGQRIMHKLIRYMSERRKYRNGWVRVMQNTTVPMRVINGPEDPVSGAHLAERYCELIPQPDVVNLPGIGHYPQVEAPQQVLEAFFAFQQKLA